MIKSASVCSGIGCPEWAWRDIGFDFVWSSEIEEFPSRVHNKHFPFVPNLGDIHEIHKKEIFNDEEVDLLIGGTPCQSYSIAGLRGGIEDPRGALTLTYLHLVRRKRPRWFVWENVAGSLSSGKGRDFGSLIGGLAELGYGYAWRMLDAKGFGSPAARRRVFLVGYRGDWRPAAEVLHDAESLSGDYRSSCQVREIITPDDAERALKNGKPVLLTMRAGKPGGGKGPLYRIDRSGTLSTVNNQIIFRKGKRPRRMTPIEYERAMGFPDDFTRVEWGSRPADECPDGLRIKAVGNSMDVRVMKHIGAAIARVDSRIGS